MVKIIFQDVTWQRRLKTWLKNVFLKTPAQDTNPYSNTIILFQMEMISLAPLESTSFKANMCRVSLEGEVVSRFNTTVYENTSGRSNSRNYLLPWPQTFLATVLKPFITSTLIYPKYTPDNLNFTYLDTTPPFLKTRMLTVTPFSYDETTLSSENEA